MEKLDLKDRKILYELDFDSRQSFRLIGKKVGLNKDSVVLRVKKLQEKGIIKNFITEFDYLKLGYTALRFYFKFQYITPEIRKEIIDYFVNYENCTIIDSIEGSYDLIVLILVKNVTNFYPFWQKTLDKYGDYFSERVYSNYVGESLYKKSFLLDEKDNRTNFIKIRSYKKVDYDNIDFQILKLLTYNSRIPTIEIAEKLKLNTKTIKNRINRLISSGIIIYFTVNLNLDLLGYQYFKVDFFLKDYNLKNKIIKYIENNPHLYAVDNTIDYADLELELYLKNINHLHEFIDDISKKFPKSIRNYKYFQALENFKYSRLDLKEI
jgi:Lrp/AsnC family transcriptional regulator for asnA, asnC and gidA